MTEEEANNKWCPYSRVSVRSVVSDGAFVEEVNAGRCIGSSCMAWRWLPLMADDAFKNAVIKAAAEMGDTSNGRHKAAQHVMANRAEYGLPTEPFEGFCGLAGRP